MYKLATFNKEGPNQTESWVLFFRSKDRVLLSLVRDLLYVSKAVILKTTRTAIWASFNEHSDVVVTQVEVMGYVRKISKRIKIYPKRRIPLRRTTEETLH